MKRRKMMALDERAGRVAEAFGALQWEARNVANAERAAAERPWDLKLAQTNLAKKAVAFARAVERARSES